MEQELGVRLPKEVQVRAVEETADTIYLVLPSSSAVGEGDELSHRELGAVAGGAPAGTASGDTCSTPACWGLTCLDPHRLRIASWALLARRTMQTPSVALLTRRAVGASKAPLNGRRTVDGMLPGRGRCAVLARLLYEWQTSNPLAYDSSRDIGFQLILKRFAACSCRVSRYR